MEQPSRYDARSEEGERRPPSDPRVAFAIRLARALHRYGTPTHQLERTMNRVLQQLRLDGMFFSTPTGIFVSFGLPEEQRTSLIRTESSEVNLAKLSQLDELADRVIDGSIVPVEGSGRVDAIVAAPTAYSAAAVVLSFSLSSATATRFFGGGWREAAAAGVIGIAIGLSSLLLTRSENMRRVFEMTAAVVAAALAVVGAQIAAPFSIYTATLASLIVLVPGLTLTTAMTELATGNLVSGTARLTGAAVIFLELAFGVALGTRIGRLATGAVPHNHPEPLPDWTLWVSLLLSPLAFIVLLKARPRDLGWITLACVLGFGGSRFGAWLLGPELGVFIGAMSLGIGANAFARLRRRPAAVMLLPGLILLVPGSIGFGSLSKFIEQDVISGVEAAFNVLLVAVALVTGLLTANVVVPTRRGM